MDVPVSPDAPTIATFKLCEAISRMFVDNLFQVRRGQLLGNVLVVGMYCGFLTLIYMLLLWQHGLRHRRNA
jgi:hypothetical protein